MRLAQAFDGVKVDVLAGFNASTLAMVQAAMPRIDYATVFGAALPKFDPEAFLSSILANQRSNFEAADSTGESDISTAIQRSSTRKLSDRELAVYLTVVVFLVVYFSMAITIKHDPAIAALSRIDGPTPFEAAMGIGALTFWAVTSRRPS